MNRALVLVALVFCACPKKDGGEDLEPQIRADGHYLSAQSAFLSGDFAKAHLEFDEVRKLTPADPRLPAAEGELFLAERKIDDALKRFEDAVKIDPRRATNWSRLAFLYAVKGQKDKSAEAVDKALTLNPKDFTALDTRADLLLEAGKVDEGVKDLIAASEVAPDLERADFVLRATEALRKAGRDADALAVLEATTSKGLASAAVWSELGDALAINGRLEDALAAYRSAAKADPRDPSLLELVGEVQLKLGQVKEAEESFQASLKLKNRSVVHVAMARLCKVKKDDACIAAEIDKALAAASGDDARESFELATLLESLDRKKDALMLFRSLSEEAEQQSNLELHLKTARLAKELKDQVAMQAACTRALAIGQAGLKCP